MARCCSSSASSTPWPAAAASACASWRRTAAPRSAVFHTRLYTATELASLLRAVGLVVEGVFGGTDGEPLRADTRMLIVARREGERDGRDRR